MEKIFKNTLVTILAIGIFVSMAGITSAVEPTVNTIELTPTQPKQKTEVTFTVEVTGENISEVWIEVEECTDPNSANYFCHPVYNLSATEDNGVWSVTKTLEYSDTAEGHCWPVVLDNGTWYSFKMDFSKWTNFTVLPADEPNGNGGNGGNGNGDSDDSPGFELILVMISLIAVIFIYKRKRIR